MAVQVRQVEESCGESRKGEARHNKARKGTLRYGEVRSGTVRYVKVRIGVEWQEGCVRARSGMVVSGGVGQGLAGKERLGELWLGIAR